MRGKGVEPTQHDVDHFSFMANLEVGGQIELLEDSVDRAHKALEQVLESGCCDERLSEVVRSGLLVLVK